MIVTVEKTSYPLGRIWKDIHEMISWRSRGKIFYPFNLTKISGKGYLQMARIHYNQNWKSAILRKEDAWMCVLCGSDVTPAGGIEMDSSLSEFRNPVTVPIVK